MPSSTRLYTPHSLSPGALIHLDVSRAHYLLNVMRKKSGDTIVVFNGEAGEWEATIGQPSKKAVSLAIGKQLAAQRSTPDLWLAFAPIKNKSELVVEKATELGVSRILPVVTQHGVVKNINMDKLTAHAIEAAEQCERHDVPAIMPYDNLAKLLGDWPTDRVLLYGDETGSGESLGVILSKVQAKSSDPKDPSAGLGMTGLLIGPEGGFSSDEHRILQSFAPAKPFGMGPRILRADTAAVAALACIQMHYGDWQLRPHFTRET